MPHTGPVITGSTRPVTLLPPVAQLTDTAVGLIFYKTLSESTGIQVTDAQPTEGPCNETRQNPINSNDRKYRRKAPWICIFYALDIRGRVPRRLWSKLKFHFLLCTSIYILTSMYDLIRFSVCVTVHIYGHPLPVHRNIY
jgi:hypothetical protein